MHAPGLFVVSIGLLRDSDIMCSVLPISYYINTDLPSLSNFLDINNCNL